MTRISYRSLLAFTVFKLAFFSSATFAEASGVESLSPEIRGLLKKEMIAVDLAMKDIITANAEGDSDKISTIARQIKNSFILKQGLTKRQKHELHSTLPKDFILKDQEFHYMAGMLSHAADMNKPELINFYYSQLFEACSSCHKAHALHRFPQFMTESTADQHKH